MHTFDQKFHESEINHSGESRQGERGEDIQVQCKSRYFFLKKKFVDVDVNIKKMSRKPAMSNYQKHMVSISVAVTAVRSGVAALWRRAHSCHRRRDEESARERGRRPVVETAEPLDAKRRGRHLAHGLVSASVSDYYEYSENVEADGQSASASLLASSKNQIHINNHRTKHTRYRVLEGEALHQAEEDSQPESLR